MILNLTRVNQNRTETYAYYHQSHRSPGFILQKCLESINLRSSIHLTSTVLYMCSQYQSRAGSLLTTPRGYHCMINMLKHLRSSWLLVSQQWNLWSKYFMARTGFEGHPSCVFVVAFNPCITIIKMTNGKSTQNPQKLLRNSKSSARLLSIASVNTT